MKIIRGKIAGAKKVVVYGPEGIGKSTFASRFPDPVFIDTEGSTKDMDVARTEPPGSWAMLLEQVTYFITHPELLKTLVIDTADWAEQLCVTDICAKYRKAGIEDFGYGKGYTFLQEEFGKFLNLLTELVEKTGVHVVLNAHAKMRKFEQPDEMGAYDRWEMKLSKGVSPMVKEWTDMLLFCNYKTVVFNVDGQGAQKGKNKAQGGKRMMYTSHHCCWDAKNRYGLPEEAPFDYAVISHILEGHGGKGRKEGPAEPEPAAFSGKPVQERMELTPDLPDYADKSHAESKEPEKEPEPVPAQPGSMKEAPAGQGIDPRIPKKLKELMEVNEVDEWDIQNVVASRGYFPADMPVRDYPADFVDGCLIGAWDKVFEIVREMKQNDGLVFN